MFLFLRIQQNRDLENIFMYASVQITIAIRFI